MAVSLLKQHFLADLLFTNFRSQDFHLICCSDLSAFPPSAWCAALLGLSQPHSVCVCVRGCTCVPCSQTPLIPEPFAWLICALDFINLALGLIIICAVWLVSSDIWGQIAAAGAQRGPADGWGRLWRMGAAARALPGMGFVMYELPHRWNPPVKQAAFLVLCSWKHLGLCEKTPVWAGVCKQELNGDQ